ncbi:MAG: DUF4097 domain-containing protein [Gammaproteobacteria bacterium]|nr:DUF4097 domain-containing protein [Gammaproteobacteria bacterium]
MSNHKTNHFTAGAALLTAMLVTAPLLAQQDIDEQRDMNPDGRFKLSLVSGDVVVEGWDQNRFQLTGTLGHEEDELSIDGDAGEWRVKIEPHQDRGWFGGGSRESTDLKLMLPHAAMARLTSVSGDFELSGLDGKELSVTTVSGEIRGSAAAGELRLKSVSGDVRFNGSDSALELNTVSGDSRLEGLAGRIRVETVSGDVALRAGAVSDLTSQSVSGDMEFEFSLATDARVKLNAHSGNVVLTLPADSRFELDSSSFSGDVYNDFERSGGDARIDANTFSGDVRIRKR